MFLDNICVLTISSFAKGEGNDPSELTLRYLTACFASIQFIPPRRMMEFLERMPDLSENMQVRVKVLKRYYAIAQLAWVDVRVHLRILLSLV